MLDMVDEWTVCVSHSWGSESSSFSAEFTTEITLVLYVTESSQTRVTAEVRFFYLYAGLPIAFCLGCYKHSFAGEHTGMMCWD
jgi:hypothetical protein